MTERSPEVIRITKWLVEEAIAERDFIIVLPELCARFREIGVPVDRCRVSWSTLHPLFEAETVLWTSDEGVSSRRFDHQERESVEWLQSPMRWMLMENQSRLDRHLADLADTDFPLFHEMRSEGYHHYFALRSSMFPAESPLRRATEDFGLYIAWCTRDPAGFSRESLESLEAVQRFLALIGKSTIYPRLIANVAATYLGPRAAHQVLSGQIRLGSGSRIRALVWFSDLRNSTRLAERLGEEAYLELLNDYFDCAGRAASEAGGEILAFIGDAVLAIFPIDGDEAHRPNEVIDAATQAARNARAALAAVNQSRGSAGDPEIEFGIALCLGDIRLGNIGIAQRLSFSVVGPSVNVAERIEKLTKQLSHRVLATAEIAMRSPDLWESVGEHRLTGVEQPVALFGMKA